MVVTAEQDEIVQRGRAAVRPVSYVVGVRPLRTAIAAREGAAAVAHGEGGADPRRDDAGAPPDIERLAGGIEDDPDDRELVHAPSTHDVTVVEAARRRRTRRGDRSLSDR
jgi:hypothetical protein